MEYNNDISKYKTIDDFMEGNNLQYDCRNFMDEELLNGYFLYRINEHDKIDHGIAGAYFLYESMMKYQKDKTDLVEKVKYNFSNWNSKTYQKRTDKCAEVIAKHNMWFAEKGEEPVYRKYNLNKLIFNNQKDSRYGFKDNPFLFLLCLIDTLEPVKLNQMNPKILNQLEIDIINHNNKVRLLIKGNISIFENSLDIKKGIEIWMKVKACKDDLELLIEFALS